ncbi:LuxR C-terminal-related transcriptional regulator [Citrobacter sp. CK180]|uniref:helix-turn-helix transcriptional regulator n=1 Tax=Citrobacter sp. CK180 TaxID=2985089 RepID=UPI0025774EC1|nr:LuxR C-terminal-related transcriptional regulator [Citrobacter sp. CK180]MDM3064401.1 LuxR C-terminal-related transcriptional regulator [Citrobacter sp. CK180]HCR3979816.1 helix-turn-helix transcriptional regulator [Citrobacter koseri]
MDLSNSVFSDDYFFIVGISTLLTSELIDENYYIVDVETTNLLQVKEHFFADRKIIAFISNDLDYYALKHLRSITFVDKRSRLNEILSCLFVNDSRYIYRVKYTLSMRESEVLSCMQKGLDANEIGKQLGMTVKTFYAHRRSLVFKLQVGNRISLYRTIARVESYKQDTCEHSISLIRQYHSSDKYFTGGN